MHRDYKWVHSSLFEDFVITLSLGFTDLDKRERKGISEKLKYAKIKLLLEVKEMEELGL